MNRLLKFIFLKLMKSALNRRQLFRLSRALMNMASGDNNGNMETNGELFLLRQVLRSTIATPNDKIVVFDVGANIGEWTNNLLSITAIKEREKLSAHCFEPSLFTFSLLKSNLQKADNGKVHLVNMGIGDVNESKNLHITHDGAGTNSLYKRRLEGLDVSYDKSETIQITTVDTYCNKNNISHVNFLKIDVEGHELAVIKGAKGMLKQGAVDYIQFEYGGCWIDSRVLFLDMYDFVTSFGYIIGKIMPDGIEFYDKYDQRLETFQMVNFLACKPGHSVHLKRISPAGL